MDPGRRRRTDRPTRHRPTGRVVAALAVVAAVAAGCIDDPDPVGGPPSTERTTTTLPPDAFGPQRDPEAVAAPPSVAWVSQFGGAGADVVAGVAAVDSAVVAVGSTDGSVGLGPGTPGGGTDVLTASLGAEDGAVTSLRQFGGGGDDAARGVASSSGTGVVLACGDTTGDLGGPPAGGTDAWCVPLDADGAPGQVAQGGSAEADVLGPVAIDDTAEHAYVGGWSVGLYPAAQDPTGGALGGSDALVGRVGADGRPQWLRQFGTAGTDTTRGTAVVEDGDAVAAGTTDGPLEGTQGGGEDGWMARFDPSGNLRWITQVGGADQDRLDAVAAGGDAGRGTQLFCGVGATSGVLGVSSAGGTDALAAAVDATGDRLWSVQFGSPADDRAAAVVVDGDTVYVAATVGGPVEGAERAALPGAPAGSEAGGGGDAVLAGLDAATGTVRWVLQFGSTADEVVSSLALTEQGLLVVGGTTSGQLGATPAAGGTDGFAVAFSPPSGGGGAASSV